MSAGGGSEIALLGMAGRFPGASSVEALWRNVCAGVESIVPLADELLRGQGVPEALLADPRYVKVGAFLEEVEGWDAGFFGVSPRQAEQLDPQHRVFLECAWEALEDAGVVPGAAGASTGVYAGSSPSTYLWTRLGFGRALPASEDALQQWIHNDYLATHVSYLLDLRGPSVGVQTACSTSLVAVHLACQALLAGECDVALAGGVSVRVPQRTGYLAQEHGLLSLDGRCRPFGAGAQGTVFGSGAGVVVLKRLADARAAGDRVVAVIRGTAVNNDGRGKAGYASPGLAAQAQVIAEAQEVAGVEPGTVGYVEAHGTGTAVGDAIEVAALTEAFRRGTSRTGFCGLGSIKGNVGHLECAAGITGLIKAALALRHRTLPPSLHAEAPNPAIDFAHGPFYLCARARPWEAADGPRRAGVSSFGIGGTNAHLVLEEAPAPEARPARPPRAHLLPVSARSPEALAALAGDWASRLDGSQPLDALCHGAGAGRAHHPLRLAAVGSTPEAVAQELAALGAEGPARPAAAPPGGPVFVFPGHGGAPAAAGEALYAREPAFREAVDRCQEVLERLTRQVGDGRAGPGQRALFTLQVGLAALWRSWGIEPGAVVGQSAGEIAAAHVAGGLTLEEAARVVCLRGVLLEPALGRGGMAVVELPREACERSLAEAAREGRAAAVAGVISPEYTLVSAEAGMLEALLASWERAGLFCRRVEVDYPSHGPLMEPIRGPLAAGLRELAPRKARVPLYSTVAGHLEAAPALDGEYWGRNLRQPFDFAGAVDRIVGDGHHTFLELSAHPALVPALKRRAVLALPSLRRGEDERERMLRSLGELYRRGHDVRWSALHEQRPPPVPLPSYPWQRRRCWAAPPPEAARPAPDRLLGPHLESSLHPGTHLWELALAGAAARPLLEHRVRGAAVLPGAVALELALEAAGAALGSGPLELRQAAFREPLPLPLSPEGAAQLVLAPAGQDGGWSFSVRARSGAGGWRVHLEGELARPPEPGAGPTRAAPPESGAREISGEAHYQAMRALGLDYGPAFQGLERAWAGGAEAVARIRAREGGSVLDSALQLLALTQDPGQPLHVPAAVGRLRVLGRWRAGEPLRAWASRTSAGSPSGALTGEARVFAGDGRLLLEAEEIQLAPLPAARREDWLYGVRWVRQQAPPRAPAVPGQGQSWLVLAGEDGLGPAVAEALRRRGARVRLAPPAGEAAGEPEAGPAPWVVDLRAAGAAGGRPPPELAASACARVLRWVRGWSRGGALPGGRLWLVTRGGQAVGAPDVPAPDLAALWGLGRALNEERPELDCRCVDLAPDPEPDEAAALAALLVEDGRERELALRRGERHLARVARLELALPPGAPPLDPAGLYLLTGGLGGLGLAMAGWLARRGARRLALLGRSGPRPEAEPALRALRERGVRVSLLQADVSREESLAGALRQLEPEGPLRGVIHAAGLLHDALLEELGPDHLRDAFAARVEGAWHLHRLTAGRPLDFFVLCSSAGALLGAAGQAAHGAASACLDALAHHRAAHGLPALSVGWGPWASVGSAAGPERATRLLRQGVSGIPPSEGLELLGGLIASGAPYAAVLPWDLPRWRDSHPGAAAQPRFSELLPSPEERSARAALEAAPEGERRDVLEALVRAELAVTLGADAARLRREQPLREAGLDSLAGRELRNRLIARFGVSLPAALVWEHPSVESLCARLARELALAPPAPAPGDSVQALSEAEAEALLARRLDALEAGRRGHG